MLSGNGRHRRPRQAPALLVAAGVTGSAIAIPLLGAASANAADGTTWDKVAECESGGSWSADTGNGYFGGLQISQDDWAKYGGTQYAASADQASRSQQIAVAEKILADKGTTPWATCALLSGLTSDSGSVQVDPGDDASDGSRDGGASAGTPGPADRSGAPGASKPSDVPDASPSAGAGSSADATTAPTAEPDKSADAPARSGETGTPEAGASTSPDAGSARPGGDPAPVVPDAGRAADPEQAAGSWSLVDTGALGSGGRHRGAHADESVTNGQKAASAGRHASRLPDTYTVRAGDSLGSIADALDVDGGWRALYEANRQAIGADPNNITAGQTLRIGD
ncbi:transglycosylase family protein [Streptomyces sp. NPDC006193]|uniref:transglycosylase family protein n=1 Tax=Streptomyces sp. NPDC006193 TaxID=3155717 RepID=UPI0033B51C96